MEFGLIRLRSLKQAYIFLLLTSLVSLNSAGSAGAMQQYHQSPPKSMLQQAKDYIDRHPVISVAIGSTGAAVVYELVAQTYNLPTLSTPLLSIGTSVVNQISADLIQGASSEVEPAAMDHLLHGVRILGYDIAMRLISPNTFSGRARFLRRPSRVDLPWYSQVFVGPVCEELVCTYGTKFFFGKWAQLIGPVIFGLIHEQYSLSGQMRCALSNFIRHRALIASPEYSYAPIISHVLYNAIILAKLNR